MHPHLAFISTYREQLGAWHVRVSDSHRYCAVIPSGSSAFEATQMLLPKFVREHVGWAQVSRFGSFFSGEPTVDLWVPVDLVVDEYVYFCSAL
jgi:hypothetical protein